MCSLYILLAICGTFLATLFLSLVVIYYKFKDIDRLWDNDYAEIMINQAGELETRNSTPSNGD